MNQAEYQRHPGADVAALVTGQQVVGANIDDAERDRRFDDARGRVDDLQRGERERDAVADRECRDDGEQALEAAAEQQQPDDEEDVVGADGDVVDAGSGEGFEDGKRP